MFIVCSEKPSSALLRRRSGAQRLIDWLPALLATTVIAIESTNTFSADNTSSWLRPIIERIVGHLTDSSWAELHHGIRKTGHFSGFGLVCFTFLRAWLLTLARKDVLTTKLWRIYSCALAVLSTAVVASLDEWHQSFLPSRTGTPRDVGIDTTGALIACFLVWFLCWRERNQRTLRVL